ncbi:16178_t:CDS:2 [Gigaspora rosea]|nr:16178_t:CDS:2 [Gigaspora rosea]
MSGATNTLISDYKFLSSLINSTSAACQTFKNITLINDIIPWEYTNTPNWNTTDLRFFSFDTKSINEYDDNLRIIPDVNMTIYSLDFLTINSGSYQGRFFSSDGMMKDFDSYSGIVGTANIKNTNMSFPLVIPVAAANNESNSQNTGNTGYLIVREGYESPKSICQTSIPNCFLLKSPLVFSMAMNSPFLFFCIIYSPIRKLVVITASSGVTIWSSWPLDFISIDLPILTTLILMSIFKYGNNDDVALLQLKDKRNNTYHNSIEAYEPFRMIFMSQPDPKVLVEVSPKILMVLGLVIYLGLDFIGSLVLLISYYGLYSVKTMALYLNSSFIILFYILLGPQFIAAAKFVWHNLLVWKLRDSILISSLLLTWPGLGFGYKSYNETDRYTWWSWYGWGSDVREVQFSQSGDNASESNWYICGFLSTIISLIYCEFSILLNTMPSNMIE